jgi:hypothetical protein
MDKFFFTLCAFLDWPTFIEWVLLLVFRLSFGFWKVPFLIKKEKKKEKKRESLY